MPPRGASRAGAGRRSARQQGRAELSGPVPMSTRILAFGMSRRLPTEPRERREPLARPSRHGTPPYQYNGFDVLLYVTGGRCRSGSGRRRAAIPVIPLQPALAYHRAKTVEPADSPGDACAGTSPDRARGWRARQRAVLAAPGLHPAGSGFRHFGIPRCSTWTPARRGGRHPPDPKGGRVRREGASVSETLAFIDAQAAGPPGPVSHLRWPLRTDRCG